MKKKIIALSAALMLFAGVVSASSINGDYKGNPIVKIMSNGKQLETDEVPAVILDGHTVVPISTLRQLGASVTWDAYGYSVDVKLPAGPAQGDNTTPDIKKIRADFPDDVMVVNYSVIDNDFTQLSFALKFDVGANGTQDKFEKILQTASATAVTQIRLEDVSPTGQIYFFKTTDVLDRFANNITSDEFIKRIEMHPKDNSSQNSNTPPQQQPSNSDGSYTIGDALIELGVKQGFLPTLDMKALALDLVEIRKTKKKSDYSVQDALNELGITGGTPTLAALKLAVKLIASK